MARPSILEVRDTLIEGLRREIVGPDPGPPAVQWAGPGSPLNGEEILRPQDRPRTRYGAGILFPNGLTYSGFLDGGADGPNPELPPVDVDSDGADDAGEETDNDDEPPILNSFVPSSLGISFLGQLSSGF